MLSVMKIGTRISERSLLIAEHLVERMVVLDVDTALRVEDQLTAAVRPLHAVPEVAGDAVQPRRSIDYDSASVNIFALLNFRDHARPREVEIRAADFAFLEQENDFDAFRDVRVVLRLPAQKDIDGIQHKFTFCRVAILL